MRQGSFLSWRITVMKKRLFSSLITSFILGCSSNAPTSNLTQLTSYTGGKSMGDATSLYWYTEKLASPSTAADYVTAGDYGWYKTDYRWAEGELRELIREGEQLKGEQGLVKYSVHVRFNKEGEAVYQQYRLDGKVFPVKPDELERYKNDAVTVATVTKRQDKKGQELIQGYWDGSTFETCSGQSYSRLEFNQTLPSFVVSRLAGVDNYVAFLGSTRTNRVIVEDLLMLADEEHSCIERPSLLSD
ncbi:DUF1481 domain-containing protein [Vibrio neptunius]|uniref:DUF1481 domain-containing protein n=2 Tax=Vibrionaceae TaxID=641 RepID=A0ABS3A239_9VIBR|nr:DUF1481 domain-containing protein [Vibrio neptunius]MBN3515949.1 DUF1481 domain-containing protein [Vibrio neptunius]MBN3550026.1 DUF1481 domain-containing protein [Vibrio neptunius]MBN3575105.1 DUF1481 domain-containing protein [Vibrio neptunius]MBN3578254.1 DUF1481 domain-containing protein [Vibrio neptunius]